jgi:hypothetical protein
MFGVDGGKAVIQNILCHKAPRRNTCHTHASQSVARYLLANLQPKAHHNNAQLRAAVSNFFRKHFAQQTRTRF